MQVAPPEDRLDPSHERHPPVVPEKRPELRVHPSLDAVVRRREGPFFGEFGVEVGEERPLADETREGCPRLPEAHVRELVPPVLPAPLLEEVVPEPAPLEEPLGPKLRLPKGVQVHQILGKAVELDARLKPRP